MNFETPILTIVTPTYNAENFIAECLENVQKQKFKNFNHLIVDGCSTDRTADIVRKKQESYKNIVLKIEKDLGIYDAMNKSMDLQESDWYFFLGADDAFTSPDVLQNIIIELSKFQNGILYGDVYYRTSGNIYDGAFDIEKILKRNLCHQGIFYHKSVFEKMGRYNLKYRLWSDYDFNLRCWLSGKVHHSYCPVVIANFADGGISSQESDLVFVKDYPDICINSVVYGEWSFAQKISILAKIFRKILLRYSFGVAIRQMIRERRIFYTFPAIIWMCLSSPYYFTRKRNKSR